MKNKRIIIFCVALAVILVGGLSAYRISNAQSLPAVGDTIQLGGIDWNVLEVKNGKALVLSDKILFKQQYTPLINAFGGAPITWEECELRQYLNGEFYDTTFSAEEKKKIVEAALETNDNPWYPPEYDPNIPWYGAPGIDTKDKVFLLSMEEVLKYFGESTGIGSKANGRSYVSDEFDAARVAKTTDGEACWWWLRSPGLFYSACGSNCNGSATITAFGGIGLEGEYVNNESGGVRPALWVKL